MIDPYPETKLEDHLEAARACPTFGKDRSGTNALFRSQ
jgi:hypothetical protein